MFYGLKVGNNQSQVADGECCRDFSGSKRRWGSERFSTSLDAADQIRPRKWQRTVHFINQTWQQNQLLIHISLFEKLVSKYLFFCCSILCVRNTTPLYKRLQHRSKPGRRPEQHLALTSIGSPRLHNQCMPWPNLRYRLSLRLSLAWYSSLCLNYGTLLANSAPRVALLSRYQSLQPSTCTITVLNRADDIRMLVH